MRILRWLAVVVVIGGLAACAGLVKTEGTAGPIAWRAVNFAVVEKRGGPAQDQPVEAQSFDLIVKNVGDRTITLTEFRRTVYRPGTQPGTSTSLVHWRLEPGNEQTAPLFSYRYCADLRGCIDSGATQVLWRIILTGRDQDDRPVDVRFDIAAPPQDTRMINIHPSGRAATDRPPARP